MAHDGEHISAAVAFAAQRRQNLAVGETHGTVREHLVEPCSGDMVPALWLRLHDDLQFAVAATRLEGSFLLAIRGLTPPG